MRHPRKVPHTSSCISVSGGSCLMVGAALSHTLSLALSCSPPCSLCALMLTCITDDDDPVIEHLVIFLIPPFFMFLTSYISPLPFPSIHFTSLSSPFPFLLFLYFPYFLYLILYLSPSFSLSTKMYNCYLNNDGAGGYAMLVRSGNASILRRFYVIHPILLN